MVGLQGSGKSTLVAERYAGTHDVVSKDHWPNARRREARQLRLVAELLAAGRSVVVDNTNPTPDVRAPLMALARQYGADAVAVFVDTDVAACVRRNGLRTGRAQVPLAGLYGTAKTLVPPRESEGFTRVEAVREP